MPALRVGAVHDPAEREAEEVARRVVSASPGPVFADPAAAGGAGAQPARRSADSQPNLDELTEPPLPAEQQDVDVPPAEDVDTDAMSAEDTAELDGGEPVDTSGDPIETLRRAPRPAVGREGGPAPRDVSARVASPGPGRRLPAALRAFMERRFGLPFEAVRIHDTSQDRRAAARIGARAFTHGSDIWLGEGESVENRALMAHELTHVVQNTRGTAAVSPARRAPGLRRWLFDGVERWVKERGERYARYIPGYTLITVLVGRQLISGNSVAMTAENLLGGLMGLHPLGVILFDRLREARVVQEAFTWVRSRLSELNITWSRVRGILENLWDAVVSSSPVRNLTALIAPLVRDIVTFVRQIGSKVLEFIIRGALKLAGPYAERIWGVLQRARESLDLILEDPLGFARNLVRAVIGGFRQFGSNIVEHLKRGLLGWLFGSLQQAGIELPARLDFRGLITLALQILGLTYQRFRTMLVRALGPRGEQKVAMIERSVEIVRALVRDGFAAIWQKLLGLIDNFRQTVIGGIQNFLIGTVIRAGLGWIAGLSNPVGAVVRVVMAIYDLIVAFIERLQQIMEVAQSIFASVGAIARGAVGQAADFIEQAIGRTVPVVISFLAAVLGLRGISRSIRNIIRRLQRPVTRALTRVVRWIKRKAKRLFARLIGRMNRRRRLPSRNFRIGTVRHRIYGERRGRRVEVMINGSGAPAAQVAAETRQNAREVDDPQSRAEADRTVADVEAADQATAGPARRVRPDSRNRNQLDPLRRLDAALEAAAWQLNAEGVDIDNYPFVGPADQNERSLIRAIEPRDPSFEGSADTHRALQPQAREPLRDEGGRQLPEPRSRYYELDHTIEKRFAKAVLESLEAIDPTRRQADREGTADALAAARREDRNPQSRAALAAREGRQPGREAAVGPGGGAAPFGLLGAPGPYAERIPEDAPDLPAVALYHRNHEARKGKGLPEASALIRTAARQADPHDALRAGLLRQINAEQREMTAKIGADTKASAETKRRMRSGIDSAIARNREIFGIGTGQQAAAEPAGRDADDPGTGTSEFPFRNGTGTPDFTALEGTGGAFAGLPGGQGDFFQRDHIIDQAYPRRASQLRLFSEADIGRIESEASAGGALDPAARRRLGALRRMPLFTARSGVGRYTEANGYAVMLYRPLALGVTQQTGPAESLDGMRREATSGIVSSAARYLRDGNLAFLPSARSTLQGGFETGFAARTALHAGEAGNAYAGEIDRVARLNSGDAATHARAEMRRIAGRVRDSLAESRTRTRALFATP